MKDKKSNPTTSKNSLLAFEEIHTGIKDNDRQAIAEGLSTIMADTYLLLIKTHNYHWNVRGPMFNSLHVMTEAQYNDLFLAADLLAERIRSLGYLAPGSISQFQTLSKMGEGDNQKKADAMIKDLVESNEQIVRHIRGLIPVAADAHDDASADILTERLQVHEKNAWMLRSLGE